MSHESLRVDVIEYDGEITPGAPLVLRTSWSARWATACG